MSETRVDLAIEGAWATITLRAESGLVVLSTPAERFAIADSCEGVATFMAKRPAARMEKGTT